MFAEFLIVQYTSEKKNHEEERLIQDRCSFFKDVFKKTLNMLDVFQINKKRIFIFKNLFRAVKKHKYINTLFKYPYIKT